jgi:gliding motility-associated-like protein
MKIVSPILYVFLFIALLGGAQRGYASITIDSLSATPSLCANDGTVTVYGRGSSSLVYAIVAGPDIRPAQSGSTFGGLPSGAYQVMITDFSNDTAIAPATVGGNYQLPDFNPRFTNPLCAGTATGTIVGNPIAAGRPPYTWTLTNTSTNVAITQSSDSFLHVAAGNYSLRQYDSCQSFATRYMTLYDPNTAFGVYVTNYVQNCDTDDMSIRIAPDFGGWAQPYTVHITSSTGSYTYVLYDSTLIASDPVDYYSILVPGISQGQAANFVIISNCGDSVFVYNHMVRLGIDLYFSQNLDSCQITYSPTFVFQGNDSAGNITYPVNYDHINSRIFDSTAGVIVDTNYFNSPPLTLIAGHLYIATLTNPCGMNIRLRFYSPGIDTPYVYIRKQNASCLDSTASILISGYNFTAQPTFSILSGPSIVSGTKPYFTHWDTITYPQVYNNPGCTSYSPPTTCYQIGGLGVGTYTFSMYDVCGHTIIDTVQITQADLTDFSYQKNIIRGCPGQNRIGFSLNYTDGFIYPGYMHFKEVHASHYSDSLHVNGYYDMFGIGDTFQNLNAGTYALELFPTDAYGNIVYKLLMPSMRCTEFRDTIVIPPYQTPVISYATQIKCNGTVNVGLQPDSSRGVPPYKYEIISGPQTSSIQAGNFFTLTQPGTYVARISDTCGFAQTFTFNVDTLAFHQVVKIGSSCLGNSVMLISEYSPYATYIWHRPNGTIYTGDTLHISPTLASDYGTYYITKIVNVNNCQDTVYGTYVLGTGSVVFFYDSICPGRSVSFAGAQLTQPGVYYDTILTASCDSVVTLYLTSRHPSYDSVAMSFCAGQSVSVGAHSYSATGIYRDTFSLASGCDSIHILDLQVYPVIHDSVSLVICSSQGGVYVGTHHYSTTGLYRDTLTSYFGCDSFYILNLSVYPAQSETTGHFYSLCTNDTVFFDNKYYTGSGLYYDTIARPGACDSVVIIFLQAGTFKYAYLDTVVCSAAHIVYGGHTYTAFGVYIIDTVPTSSCDSITVFTINPTSFITDSVSRNICTGQSITVGTHIYNATGIYRDTSASSACDSIHILNLQVSNYKRDTAIVSICSGQSVTIGTHVYNTTGIYRDTFSTTSCDSIYILNLQVSDYKRDSLSLTVCIGGSVTVGTHVYNATGIYRDTFPTATCDSIYILNLQIGGYKYDSASLTLCPGQAITVRGHIYNAAGIYRDTLSTTGCDSIHILNIQIGNYRRDSASITICNGQSISVGSHIYASSGTYRDTFATVSCDSIYTLYLAVTAGKSDTIDLSFCRYNSVTVAGHTYTQPGMYTDTFGTSACDSIRTIRVTVWPLPELQLSASALIVSEGDTVQLSATSSQQLSYSWVSSAVLSSIYIADPLAIITQSVWVTVQAADTNHCEVSDSLFITVKDCDGTIFVPNAFTPNGDGVNDVYYVFGRCIRLNDLEIFNRWGEKVFESHDISQGWDGSYKGSPQPTEVYVYILNYNVISEGGSTGKEMKGSITLIR